MTGGSSTTRSEFDRYRKVGATAKDMLVRAAAARWKVSADKLIALKGVIVHGQKKLRYGEVADEAMKLPPPASVVLKEPRDWKLIGKPTRRLDSLEKITGKAKFGIDVTFPDFAHRGRPSSARVRREARSVRRRRGPENSRGREGGANAERRRDRREAFLGGEARSRRAPLPSGRSPKAEASAPTRCSPTIDVKRNSQAFRLRPPGDVAAGLSSASTKLVAEYEVPYLAHAPMEPLNCTAKVDGDRCEIWTGTQFQTIDQKSGREHRRHDDRQGPNPHDVPRRRFGRRANPHFGFVAEAVTVAKAAGVP